MTAQPTSRWVDLAEALGPTFAARATAHDEADRFVAENYRELRAHKAFSALVPAELGGGGAGHAEICAALRALARHCASTALALAMHQHLVATAAIYDRGRGWPGRRLLERVAEGELVLASSGANDWLASNGEARRVAGAFRVTARKSFASGAPAADLLVTSAPYEDPVAGWQVLHFPVALAAAGVRVENDWRALGMRGTGSHSIVLTDVFVPDAAVILRRPRGQYHPFWTTVIGLALPLIMSVYLGVAERCAALALGEAKRRPAAADPQLVGAMLNRLTAAQLSVEAMVGLAGQVAGAATLEIADAMLVRKTLAAEAVIATCAKALQVTGGTGYFRAKGIERLLRDAYAAQFHLLPEHRQQEFTGRRALGLDPVAG